MEGVQSASGPRGTEIASQAGVLSAAPTIELLLPEAADGLGAHAALGADLAVPGALLTGVIQRAGHAGQAEGAYFGWWNFATKLNLALAAGVALPLLAAFGYTPGGRDAEALQALTLAYCALPCLLKLGAAALLWTLWIAKEPSP